MINPHNVPNVEPDEMLARFILSRRHIRSGNDTIMPDAFIPHPYRDLSVTRHLEATESELWATGQAVASAISAATSQRRTLHGRGDVVAGVFLERGLEVKADPIVGQISEPDNPNHAIVTGWPENDEGRQRLLALQIAASAKLVRSP